MRGLPPPLLAAEGLAPRRLGAGPGQSEVVHTSVGSPCVGLPASPLGGAGQALGSPMGARQQKSDLFKDLSGLGVRLHFLRVFRDGFSINLLKVCTVLLRIPMSFG